MVSFILKCIFRGFCVVVSVFWCAGPLQAQESEKTYSISLVKTAENQEGTEIHEVDDRKILTQEYTVQKGDHVWQLFRERGLLEDRNLSELLSVLKTMNRSLDNLNLIHPGQKILIPLRIAPVGGAPVREETVQVADLKDIDFRNYTVQKDDTVIKVIKGMYQIPEDNLYRDYLQMVRQMNPDIQDLDAVYPGQSIRLPIYSPEVVRAPVRAPGPVPSKGKTRDTSEPPTPNPVVHDLAEIFMEMGEELVRSGEHFIPLKTGGQINLKASAFPIINLRKGPRVIVDLDSKLPPKMARLIESSWDNYRVVHLTKDDGLRSALDKVIRACGFPKLYGSGEPLVRGKDVSVSITGDWIVRLPENGSHRPFSAAAINLVPANGPRIPVSIRHHLLGLGVKVIDYPPAQESVPAAASGGASLNGGKTPADWVRSVLDLTGKSYAQDLNIPVYQSKKDDLKLIIRADISLELKGKDAVIDLTGLAPEVISLLEEQGFRPLALANEKDPLRLIARTCEFLALPFQPGPQHFMVLQKEGSGNVKLTLAGVIFSDAAGDPILATPLDLPNEIHAFLAQRGYRILGLGN